mmetsp:Transcript_48637/g.152882  ORF Transcript_48637/g.152882 Transcript_48637/m.152882 type:complete len:321 (+) Transcript_48637:248-1210(+)
MRARMRQYACATRRQGTLTPNPSVLGGRVSRVLLEVGGEVVHGVVGQDLASLDEAFSERRDNVPHEVLPQRQLLEPPMLLLVLFDDLQPSGMKRRLPPLKLLSSVIALALFFGRLFLVGLLPLGPPREDLLGHLLLCGEVVEGPAGPLHVDPRALEHVILVLARNGQVENADLGNVLEEVSQAARPRQVRGGILLHLLLEQFWAPQVPRLPASTEQWLWSFSHHDVGRADVLVELPLKLFCRASFTLLVLSRWWRLLILVWWDLGVVAEEPLCLLVAHGACVEDITPVAADLAGKFRSHCLKVGANLQARYPEVLRDCIG